MGVLFGTDGIRGIANKEPMTVETVSKIGKIVGLYFSKKSRNIRFLIGKDTRVSGDMIENAIISGIVSSGLNVHKLGIASTPSVAYLTKELGNTIGIVISASHNPVEDNGIKIFSSSGFKLPDKVENEIESMIFSYKNNNDLPIGKKIGKVIECSYLLDKYEDYVVKTIPKIKFNNMKVVVDCANGANYKIAPKVFSKLGIKIKALNSKPNGININEKCGALYSSAAASKVVKEKADCGISFDGDGDRVIMTDEKGGTINGDHIMAIYSDYMNNNNKCKKIKSVVGTIMSNIGLELFMKENNINFIRASVGDRYVLEEMLNNKSSIGGEQSGHIIFLDKSITGDGLLTALQMLYIMKKTGKTLGQLSSCVKFYPQILVNVKVKRKRKLNEMPLLMKEIKDAENLLSDKGRVNFRYSGTENIARVMLEGYNEKIIKLLSNKIVTALKKEM